MKLSKSCQKIVKKLSKSCQKVVNKCQSCPKIVTNVVAINKSQNKVNRPEKNNIKNKNKEKKKKKIIVIP
jgi:mRNA-degrading endonuclease RelE of RelBE toxin-antitoxin system